MVIPVELYSYSSKEDYSLSALKTYGHMASEEPLEDPS